MGVEECVEESTGVLRMRASTNGAVATRMVTKKQIRKFPAQIVL